MSKNEENVIIRELIREAIDYIVAGTSDKGKPKIDEELIKNGISTLEFTIDKIKEFEKNS